MSDNLDINSTLFRGGRVAAVAGMIAMLSSSCAHGSNAVLERQVGELQTQVVEVQRANVALQQRIEELNHWLFLLQDRVDSNQVSLSRQPSRPELKVVKLTPEPAAKPAPAASAASASVPASALAPAVEPAQDSSEEPVLLTNSGLVRPTAPSPSPPAAAAPPRRKRGRRIRQDPVIVGAYREALDLLEGGQANQALLKFARFVENYPNHDLTDNALYWSGEAYFDQKEYGLALAEFQRVINEHPKGNKVPDSLLKLALCLDALKGRTKAKNVLYQLVDLYPSSEAARLAQEKLATLE